jgi:hypothetical protein
MLDVVMIRWRWQYGMKVKSKGSTERHEVVLTEKERRIHKEGGGGGVRRDEIGR